MALDFFAGSVAGAAGVLAGHPLDTVKVRLQTQGSGGRYGGLFSCIRLMIAEEGVASLYKGLSSPLAGLAAVNAVIFGVQGATLRALPGEPGPAQHFLAGSVAGLAQSFLTSPMELVKTRLQIQGQGQPDHGLFSTRSQTDVYRGPLDCLRSIYRQGGLGGLARGLGPTIARDAPAFGLYFWSYEVLTRAMDPRGAQHLGAPQLLFAGGTAGALSWLATYPQDVVKSRIQADGIYRHRREFAGAWDCLQKVWHKEGVAGMRQGLGSALARAFVLNAVTFYVVEWVFRMHARHSERLRAEGGGAGEGTRREAAWERYNFHMPLPEAGTTFLLPHVYKQPAPVLGRQPC